MIYNKNNFFILILRSTIIKKVEMQRLTSKLRLKIESLPTNTILREDSAYTEQKYNTLQKYKADDKITIPDSFDGRITWKGLLSPVINQGSCGSCWAFASTACLADRFNIQSLGLMHVELSAAKLILCNWEGPELELQNINPELEADKLQTLNLKSINTGACFGNTLYDAWRYLYLLGTPTEQCVPYNKTIGTNKVSYKHLSNFADPTSIPFCTTITGMIGDMCAGSYYDEYLGEETGEPAKRYRAYHFYAVAGTKNDKGSEYDIRYNIYNWGTVTTGFTVYPDFYTFDAKKEIYKWNGKGSAVGGHAVCIVGWGEEKGTKYWIIRNTWGKKFGDDGYFRMIRGTNECSLEENVVTGIPDFFWEPDFVLGKTDYFLASDELVKERQKIISPNSLGGGIDPTTGYTRRVLNYKAWVDLERPVKLEDLPKTLEFIAGTSASSYNRDLYKKKIRQRDKDIKYDKRSLYLAWVLLIVIIIVTLFYLLNRKN